MKKEALRHPKLHDLAAQLQCTRVEAIGYLTLLWDFTEDNSPQGNVGKWSDGAIARACEWRGDPEAFIKAMLDTRWLDKDTAHRLLVHDWKDHCQSWVRAKLGKSGLPLLTPTSVASDPDLSRLSSPPQSPLTPTSEPSSRVGAPAPALRTEPSLTKPSQAEPSQTQPTRGCACAEQGECFPDGMEPDHEHPPPPSAKLHPQMIPLPVVLDVPSFREVWFNRWVPYLMRKSRYGPDQITLQSQLAELARDGPDRAIVRLEHSMTCDWKYIKPYEEITRNGTKSKTIAIGAGQRFDPSVAGAGTSGDF